MARITMLTFDHSPLDDRIFYKEAQSLVAAGHKLSLVCVANVNNQVFDMGGTQQVNPKNELVWEYKSVEIHAIPEPATKKEKLANKLFTGRFYNEFVNTASKLQSDIYIAHEPQTYYAGLAIQKRVSDSKLVFDSHESWFKGTPKENFILRKHLKNLQFLISANHITRGYLQTMHPTLEAQVVYNAAEMHLFSEPSPERLKHIKIAHDGYLPFNRGLREMLEAIRIAKTEVPEVHLKIIGTTTGNERAYFNEFVTKHGLEENISETGWLPYQKVGEALRDCAIGIIAKQPILNNVIGGPPIKYFNYTAAQMAVVDVRMPETTRLLSTYLNGISLQNNSAKNMAEALTLLYQNSELLTSYCTASKKASETLNWESESEKLVRFIDGAVLNKQTLWHHK